MSKMSAADQGLIAMHTLAQKKFHMQHPSFGVTSSAQAAMEGTTTLKNVQGLHDEMLRLV